MNMDREKIISLIRKKDNKNYMHALFEKYSNNQLRKILREIFIGELEHQIKNKLPLCEENSKTKNEYNHN